MTTEYSKAQSPRLPSNHPAHVERILARAKARREWSMGFIYALTLLCWLFCAGLILYSMYE